ncbi:uncharacterized protein [Amphiura filiformis]|uniref:uncharacterized protein n=1 Tax=Amphiura filiformis TaxID=82378 RepID=UPI003B21B845
MPISAVTIFTALETTAEGNTTGTEETTEQPTTYTNGTYTTEVNTIIDETTTEEPITDFFTHPTSPMNDLNMTTTDSMVTISTSPDEQTTLGTASGTTSVDTFPTTTATKSPTATRSPVMTTPLTGPVPAPEYPDLDDGARKVIVVDISVLDSSGCFPDLLLCDDFKQNFIEQVKPTYGNIVGLDSVEVIELRNETVVDPGTFASYVIVQHNVNYVWNDMDKSDRGLTANDIYEKTVESGIAEGKIGELIVSKECNQCKEPKEATSLCTNNEDVTCTSLKYFDPYCLDGLPECRSKCVNAENLYCGNNGICTHTSVTSKPTCGCLHDQDIFYFGENCQLQMNKLAFLIGVTMGGSVIVLLIVILCACLVVGRRKKKQTEETIRRNRIDEEELGMYNYGYTSEMYDPAKPDAVVFAASKDQGEMRHSYNYIYTDGTGRPPSHGNEIAKEAAKKQAEKHKNSSFWGNLNGETSGLSPASGGNEMRPILTHIDTSQGYRIQRPTKSDISPSLPETDYNA